MKVKHLTVLALIACCAIFGAQQVLAAKPHRQSNERYREYDFAVLENAPAKISDARQEFLGIPSGAALTESVGGNNIYVFQRVYNLEAQTCLAREGSDMTSGTACGSTEAAEREGLSLIHPMPDGTQRLIVLVPNGVKTVSTTTPNNSSTAVPVTNNIAIVEGDLTAYHFVSPSGSDVSIPLEG
jgi:hypothetical protein